MCNLPHIDDDGLDITDPLCMDPEDERAHAEMLERLTAEADKTLKGLLDNEAGDAAHGRLLRAEEDLPGEWLRSLVAPFEPSEPEDDLLSP